ncbi:mCG147778 [Mus musculus]|nr:mCG147778 [Mus musculus]
MEQVEIEVALIIGWRSLFQPWAWAKAEIYNIPKHREGTAEFSTAKQKSISLTPKPRNISEEERKGCKSWRVERTFIKCCHLSITQLLQL